MTLLSHLLLACAAPPLATIPGATRLAELANGELLVGTASGELWRVTTFGESTLSGMAQGGSVRELVTDPVGRYWAAMADGVIVTGTPWEPPVTIAQDASLLVRGCETTTWTAGSAADVTARALGSGCDRIIEGTIEGRVAGKSVSRAPIHRVQSADGGVLWVDTAGNAGCLDCSPGAGANFPETGVVDAIVLHLPPFVPGELVWIDDGGRLWAVPR